MRTGAKGVTGFLPTVVTDAPDVLAAALTAARKAHVRVPGALGVHVEGPFIDPRRQGVHPPEFIRPMRENDAEALIAMRAGAMVVTLAPASVPLELVARLANAGIVVSLGHSDATAEEAAAVFDAGARAATHLFNAMSQLNSRAPGVVGAVLADPRVICGLIADGEHAHPAAYRAAVAAKGPGGIALVSDAMPPAAGGPDVFELQGRTMRRVGLKLVDENGTLAGAAITMRDAVRYAATTLGLPLASVADDGDADAGAAPRPRRPDRSPRGRLRRRSRAPDRRARRGGRLDGRAQGRGASRAELTHPEGGPNFPITGKRTANFAQFRPVQRHIAPENPTNSMRSRQNSLRGRSGIDFVHQGTKVPCSADNRDNSAREKREAPLYRARSFIAIRAASAPDRIAPLKPQPPAKDEAR